MQQAYFPTVFNIGLAAEQMEGAKTAVSLTEQDWQLLRKDADKRHYDAGDLILKEGERSQALYMIEQGEVRVEQQPNKQLDKHGAGAVFGEMSFLTQRPASASVIAVGHVEVSVVALTDLQKMLKTFPGLATRFYQTLAVTVAERLYQAVDLLQD